MCGTMGTEDVDYYAGSGAGAVVCEVRSMGKESVAIIINAYSY